MVTLKDILSVTEASRYLAIDEAQLTLMASERRIPSLELNGAWVFAKKSIDKWHLQQQRRRA